MSKQSPAGKEIVVKPIPQVDPLKTCGDRLECQSPPVVRAAANSVRYWIGWPKEPQK
jgi:hypothetical protein